MSGKSSEALRRERQVFRKKLLRRGALLFLAALLVFSVTSPGRSFWNSLFQRSGFSGSQPEAEKAPLKIHFLDVGKADAILLECNGHAALLDSGTAVSGDTVVDYLTRNGVRSLDYVILSHPDKDHIGGMAQVLREIPVNSLIQAELPESLEPQSDEYAALQAAREERQIPCRTVKPGDTFTLGAAEFTVLGPLREYGDTNDSSLVLKLAYQEFSALFCGDIEKEAEKDLAKSGENLSATLLKVPHHGSKTSSTKRFLKAVDPRYAVISVGPDNNGLPREEALIRLEESGAEIYRTDTDGTIVFFTDGKAISIDTEK